jgi:hypothetical protein
MPFGGADKEETVERAQRNKIRIAMQGRCYQLVNESPTRQIEYFQES